MITLDENKTIEDQMFIAYSDVMSPNYNKDFARQYGLDNWEALSNNSKGLWDHVFGKETRLHGFVTKSKEYWETISKHETILLKENEKMESI